jgi:(2Fe-2S) ferredoxin
MSPGPKRYVVSICSGPDCRSNGSDALVPRLAQLLQSRQLTARCQTKRGGCYGLCDQGANVIVREVTAGPSDPLSREDFELVGSPGETHYAQMDSQRLERVVDEHLACDRPVKELKGRPD